MLNDLKNILNMYLEVSKIGIFIIQKVIFYKDFGKSCGNE